MQIQSALAVIWHRVCTASARLLVAQVDSEDASQSCDRSDSGKAAQAGQWSRTHGSICHSRPAPGHCGGQGQCGECGESRTALCQTVMPRRSVEVSQCSQSLSNPPAPLTRNLRGRTAVTAVTDWPGPRPGLGPSVTDSESVTVGACKQVETQCNSCGYDIHPCRIG